MWCGFLYKTAITRAQNSQGGNSRNVTTLDWAKLAKRWQALSLSDKQTNRHQALTYTSRSSLGAANAHVRLSKLARRHQSDLCYRTWVRAAAHQIINPRDHIMRQSFSDIKGWVHMRVIYFSPSSWEMKDYTFFGFLLVLRPAKALESCSPCCLLV